MGRARGLPRARRQFGCKAPPERVHLRTVPGGSGRSQTRARRQLFIANHEKQGKAARRTALSSAAAEVACWGCAAVSQGFPGLVGCLWPDLPVASSGPSLGCRTRRDHAIFTTFILPLYSISLLACS